MKPASGWIRHTFSSWGIFWELRWLRSRGPLSPEGSWLRAVQLLFDHIGFHPLCHLVCRSPCISHSSLLPVLKSSIDCERQMFQSLKFGLATPIGMATDWLSCLNLWSTWKESESEVTQSFPQLFVTPWPVAYQASLSMGFSRKEYWSGVPLPSLQVLLNSL